jgi:branched-chain amino acid transport system permease protein
MKRAKLRPAATIVAAALAAAIVLPLCLPSYWVFLFTTVVISGIALQSVGIVAGRTGMISLCQMSFAGVGAWTVAWLNVHDAPGSLLLWVVIGGVAAVPLGVAIGLPALRLRGINLAIVTLGFAAAFDGILGAFTFPGQTEYRAVARPELFESDEAYLVLCIIAFALIAVALEFVSKSRLGAAWLSIRHSERATAAHGVSIPRGRLSAFALSAFIAGVSGGLLAGQLGTLVSDSFNIVQSLALFVVATMVGAQHPEGAIFGGVLMTLFPELLRRLNLPQDIGNIAFAVGATQALSMGASTSEAWRQAAWRRRQRRAPSQAAPPSAIETPAAPIKVAMAVGGPPALAVRGLTVRYGSVVALDRVDLLVEPGTVTALIGPNGAGKSTLIDAVTGFLPGYDGTVECAGRPLDGLPAHHRARLGVRRTWQQTRIAPDLAAGGYVRLAAGRPLADDELADLLHWLGCPGAEEPVAAVDVGTRRLLDIAGIVAARPTVILLDEPAAGQSHQESLRLAQRIAEIPGRYGSAVVLVEHDIDLVRMACAAVTVLDFGEVIASGAPAEVLANPAVVKAYLGVDETEPVS